MRKSLKRMSAYIVANLGHCATCMRQALGSAIMAWVVFGLSLLLLGGDLLHTLLGSIAAGLTGLWLLHIVVHVVRAVRKSPKFPDARSSAKLDFAHEELARRQMLTGLLRTAGYGILASLPPLLWPTAGYAFCGQCTKDDDCGGRMNGWCCINTAPVNAGYVCNECKKC